MLQGATCYPREGNVLANDGPGPLGSATVKEEHPAHGRNRPRADRPRAYLARDHRARRQVEPRAPRVGRSVRGPRHVVTSGQTPVLDPAEARALLDSIDTSTVVGLRDRALIGLMVYSFAQIGAALGMAVEDVFTQNRRLWVRLREKGGKRHAMPCHHNLEEYLIPYLDGGSLRADPRGSLFRTIGLRHRQAHAHCAATGECLCDDPPARRWCGHRH